MTGPITPAGNGMERLPCGCLMGTSGDTFLFEPCSMSCENYLYVVAETKRQGKPVTTLDLGRGDACPLCRRADGGHELSCLTQFPGATP